MTDTPFKNAYWIWDDGDPKPVNAYRVFRKEFEVGESDTKACVAYISAQTQYCLIVNGSVKARGPAPSARGYISYDEVDLDLQPGQNIIEIEVHSIGIPIFSQINNPGGLIFEMGEIASDETWYVAKTSSWLSSPRWSNYLGFSEIKDTNSILAEWEPGAEINKDTWQAATQVCNVSKSRYGELLARGAEIAAPPSGKLAGWIKFSTLIGYGNCVSDRIDDTAGRLENETLLPLTSGSVSLDEFNNIRVQPADHDIWLLLDMGCEVSGTFDLDAEMSSELNNGAKIDIGYSEGYEQGKTPSGMIHGDKDQDFRYADQLVLSGGDEDWFASFGSRAFRYVRLALRGLKAPITIVTLGVHPTTYPVQNRGDFISSDARLDKIWEVGRRTLQLCMADTFMDCPQRERAQYIADTRIQAIGAQYCFGDTKLHRRFLEQTALGQHPDGRLDPCGPGEWDIIHPNAPIPGFMAIYVQSSLDYYMHTGDGDLIREIMPTILKALGWLASYGGAEGGLLTQIAGWNFTDWAIGLDNWNPGFKTREPGVSAPVNLFYLEALRAAAYLAELAGDQAAAISCRTRATMVAGAFDSLFWSVQRGVYADSVIAGEQQESASQQVNVLALLSGLGSEIRKELILESLFSDESLTQIGSPYFSYYLVQALAKCGQQQTALDYIREKWGAMLDAGATSWWETWDGKKSRCHGWSIAPTIWLTEQVLGVTPHEPGWACVNVAPKLCDLKWARGVVPIPQGDVQVAWTRGENQTTIDITAPVGVHIRPILPCSPSDLLIVDGELVAPDSIVVRTSTYAEIAVLPGSGYRFEVVERA